MALNPKVEAFVYIPNYFISLFFILITGSENCFNVKTFKKITQRTSWTLGSCSKSRRWDQTWETYVDTCCLDAGSYQLSCDASGNNGWDGGFIEIQGKRYCENFLIGHQERHHVNITTIGNHLFKLETL